MRPSPNRTASIREWPARIAVGAVFIMNIWCALAYLAAPEAYAPGYGLAGSTGRAVVQAFGVLFLMWNATYPPVIWRPQRYLTLFAIVLVQQLIGLAGEALIVQGLPASATALRATGLRFALFDGAGLLLMLAAFLVLRLNRPRT